MNAPLLLKLASHLEAGHLFYEWNFAQYRTTNACGTCGCAIGELGAMLRPVSPVLDELLNLHNRHGRNPTMIHFEAMKLLDLKDEEYAYLFLPLEDDKETTKFLTTRATPRQVAALIRDFVTSGVMRERDEDELERYSRFSGDFELSNDLE